MTLLIIGATGHLGRELTHQALAASGLMSEGRAPGGGVAATYRTAPAHLPGAAWYPADIRDRDQVADLIAAVGPHTVINAAYAKSDWATTADGAAHVALAATAVGARLVHVSSDAVFSGAATPYTETAPPDPTTPYGAAKAAAETAVAAVAPGAVIARTSLIIGDATMPSVHERRVHALIAGETTGPSFTDDIRCPVHVTDLASALLELAATPSAAGIHHVTGPDALSRHELATLIAHRDALDPTRLRPALRAETPIPGPLDVRLDCAATRRRLRTTLRGARRFLRGDGR